ncbi:MAG TPA: hypothetical protein VFQ39_11930, partial [Longimicrobium sp.]|nr:hypothetical protein [Longimicrobium sp.]
VAEMFYMLAPDPNGTINGNTRSKDYVRQQTVGVVGHEFQHLINASRRLYVVNTPNWDETVWLNEGLSHIAEELIFYSVSGMNARSNITISDLTSTTARLNAFNSFGISNFGRIGEYYDFPESSSPIADDDELSTRGATWQLLRYLADRRGGNDQTFFFNLVNTANTGTANLAAASGVPAIDPWIRDWGVAVYTDDAVPGVAAQYTQPSWNFRNILANPAFGNGFPLATQTLASGVPLGVSITGGSQAYLRFAVAAGQTGTIRSAAGGTTVAGACQTTLNLAVGEVFHGTPANASVVCAPGGAAGQEYVLIPHFSGESGSAAVSVTGENVIAPVGPPTPDRSPYGIPSFSQSLADRGDGGFELRLRQRERVELNRALGRPTFDVAADPVAATVTLTYVRTK